jgi:uncharacterized protein (UPF0333 family)
MHNIRLPITLNNSGNGGMKILFRAQISLEFIIIFAIALSFLILWLPLVLKTGEDTTSQISDFYIKDISYDLQHISDSLCILGEGNTRQIDMVANHPILINSSGKSFTVSDESQNLTSPTKCRMNISLVLDKGRTSLIIKNENEIISAEIQN